MPRDILSRSENGPQQQLQPALLPDQKGRQQLLERGAILGKFDFHAHAAHAKAVRIDGPFHKPGHIVRDFHIFILGVPVVKVAQIDGWPDGTKRMRDIYAATKDKCEQRLAVMITEMKREVVAEKERLRAVEKAGRSVGPVGIIPMGHFLCLWVNMWSEADYK